jgi:hypothetical protein
MAPASLDPAAPRAAPVTPAIALSEGRASRAAGPGTKSVEVHLVAVEMSSFGDPVALMMQAQLTLREHTKTVKEAGLATKETQSEVAEQAKKRALEEAVKVQEKSGFLRGKIGKLIKGIAVAAAAAASVVTGGASMALAVAGIALMVGGEHIAKGLAKAGIISESGAKWLSLGLQLVGAALTMGAGAAGGAANAASSAAKTAKSVANVVDNVAKVSQGLNEAAIAGLDYKHDELSLDAQQHQLQMTRASDGMEENVEALEELFAQFRRVVTYLQKASQAQQEAKRQALRMLG